MEQKLTYDQLQKQVLDLKINIQQTEEKLQEIIVSREQAEEKIKQQYSEIQEKNNDLEASNERLANSVSMLIKTTSKLKKSEARFKLAFEATNEGMWDMNLFTGEAYFSQRYYTMLGYEQDEFVPSYEVWINQIHPDDIQRAKETVDKHIKNRSGSFSIECRLKTKNEKFRWVLSRGKIVGRKNNSAAIRMIGTHTDITNIKEYEAKLIKAKEKAEEADVLKSAFLANMSHEIRTPLNAIIGGAELLKSEEMSPDGNLLLNIMTDSGEHLLEIINDIVDISKIEAGQLKIYTHECKLNSLCDLLHSSFNSTIKAKMLDETEDKGEIKLILEKGLSNSDAIITTDELRVRQVLSNLIGNALKFTHSGFIKFGYELTDNKQLKFYVKDSGIGMPANKLNVIFDRFSQADSSVTREYGGTGLGLTISKALIEMLGGNIWVNSEYNKGATFYFTIPYDNKIVEKQTR